VSTAELIRQYIEQQPLGEPFTTAALLQFGTRKAVDLELARLVKNGVLMRAVRGVYVRPKKNRYIGFVPPEPFKVAMATAGGKREVHGAEAARRLGLSTQVPVQPVYYTTGPSRRIQFGGIPITLIHVSPRKMVAPGTNVGLAISALWYLGRHQVEPETFQTIREKLSEAEYEELKAAIPMMPGWMAETMMRYERELRNG
jgi:hypothetical protein